MGSAAQTLAAAMSNHIILLVQTSDDAQTRTYLDFASPSQAWDSVVRLFEERREFPEAALDPPLPSGTASAAQRSLASV